MPKARLPKIILSKRRIKLPKRMRLLIGGSILLIGLAAGCSMLVLHVEDDRYKQIRISRVQSIYTVAGVLVSHPTSTLVSGQGLLNVLQTTLAHGQRTFALNNCPSVADSVTEKLKGQSIAVLLDINNTPGPHQCTLAQIVQAYGRPNSSTTISGTLKDPKEVLLFYDKGPELSGPLKPVSPPQAPATVVPITLATLPTPACTGKTTLSFVAHEDDDLLFMNPDHLHELHGGACLRTVYLTAGDAGMGSKYWLSRQKGAEAAYDAMLGGGASLWLERYVEVNSHEYIKMASPRGNPSVTLVFVGLPDGNLSGIGFPTTHGESLARLNDGTISKMVTDDRQSSYSKTDLTNLLVNLMQYFHPDQIDTQTPTNMSAVEPDHSDHITTGKLTAAAFASYGQSVPLTYYTGYPIDQLSSNLSDQDIADKSAAFYAYTVHDINVCQTPADCAGNAYAQWLGRQYTYTPGMSPIPVAPAPVTPNPVTSPPAGTPPAN